MSSQRGENLSLLSLNSTHDNPGRTTRQWSAWRQASAVCDFVSRGPPPSLTLVVRRLYHHTMSNISFELQDQLAPILRSGDLAQCERIVSARLAALPTSPFHIILDLPITTDAEGLAAGFDEFFQQQGARFKIEAAYTEMNGFDINTDLWFCQPFAYQKYGGLDDFDWLSDWQSDEEGGFAIEGLEQLQAVYASDTFRDERFDDACSVTSLLVVIRFQDLIRRAAPHMQELRFPLLATAHDYDFIYEVRRDA